MADIDYDALTSAADRFRFSLEVLELARVDHPNDRYLQGQAREHVWQSYWDLRAAADDSPKKVKDEMVERGAHALADWWEERQPGCYDDGDKPDVGDREVARLVVQAAWNA